MSLDTWLAYVATVLLFMCTPGPSHLLMLSTSMANGFRRSVATAAGDLTANAVQMTAAGLGLATLLIASQTAFSVVKWLGVAYLVWLGVRMIRRSFGDARDAGEGPRATPAQLWFQGFVTSAANPKAVVFFAALFPQFIEPHAALVPQILILGATYLFIDATFLCAYGATASWLATRLRGPIRSWLDRIAGTSLIGAAVLLGLKSAPASD